MTFMKIISDLQIHSKYARATSSKLSIPYVYSWAQRKGIQLMATGDWTHPLWIREIKNDLEEDGSGFLKLKKEVKNKAFNSEFFRETLFMLGTELSSIYTQGGKARRIHNLIWSPSLKTADKIIAELNKRGCNLASDGRPIIGLTSIEIAELVLSIDEKCMIVPAHIWTPYFSLYGSKSGFDSVEECFGDFAKYIYGIETGLSSDPVMNWRIGDLDNRAILSFSDAHSGPKIGREATVFDLKEITYEALREAIIKRTVLSNSKGQSFKENRISGTIEFYPEEGKYHYTGHRNCNVRQDPKETKEKGTICHVCGRPLTIGVMHRVEELATRDIEPVEKIIDGVRWMYHPENKKPPYVNLVPLMEIISEAEGSPVTSPKVIGVYEGLTENLATEFEILLKTPFDKIAKVGSARIAEAVKKVRAGRIVVDPGYDGVFGVVKIWDREEEESSETEEEKKEQMSLF